MRPLDENEQKQAIELIQDFPFDADIISSIRGLLQKHAAKNAAWKRTFDIQPTAYSNTDNSATVELDDTVPFTPLPEIDGD